jgi:hypothetical protein
VVVLKIGLVANPEDNQELEINLEGGDAGEDGPVHTTHFQHSSSSGSPALVTLLAPLTPTISQALRPGTLPLLHTNSRDTPCWLNTWAHLPHQKEGLLLVDVTKTKLHQICGFQ